MRLKDILNTNYYLLAGSILFWLIGLKMLKFHIFGIGINGRNMEGKVVGGYSFIFLGIVSFVVFYFSLSPFSKLREFVEGRSRRRNEVSRKKS